MVDTAGNLARVPFILTPEMQAKNLREAQDFCTAVNEALADTQALGLPLSEDLDAVWAAWLADQRPQQALESLRNVWVKHQSGLVKINARHPGALEYFVRFKDGIRREIERAAVLPSPPPAV